MRRIGVLLPGPENDPSYVARVTIVRGGLEKLGWVEGRNVQFNYRWTDADANRTRAYAAELVGLGPEVILTANTSPVRDLLQATRTIPIVFVSVSDPVGDGFAGSLRFRPGGNTTGFSNYDPAMVGKWLELLKEIAPNTKRVAVVYNPDTAPHSVFWPPLQAAGQSFGLQMVPILVRSVAEIESTIAALGRERGLASSRCRMASPLFGGLLVTAQAAKHRVPGVYPFTGFATSGGLVSYGVDSTDQYRGAVSYIDRILRGAKPADLPVQQPTKFELVINLKTAKALRAHDPTIVACTR